MMQNNYINSSLDLMELMGFDMSRPTKGNQSNKLADDLDYSDLIYEYILIKKKISNLSSNKRKSIELRVNRLIEKAKISQEYIDSLATI